eukprot:77184_1
MKVSFMLKKKFKKNVLKTLIPFHIVPSIKHEYIIQDMKENEYAFRGGDGYEKDMVLIKTTVTNVKQQNVTAKMEQNLHKLVADDNHKIILVCGKTGAGKTTLINSMMNYIYGVKIDDTFRMKLIEEEKKSEAYSHTDHISSYTIKKPKQGNIDYSLT